MPRYTRNGDVVTIPDVLIGQYEKRGWEPYGPDVKPRPLSDYTKVELEALAQSRGVDVHEHDSKAEMIAKLSAPPDED